MPDPPPTPPTISPPEVDCEDENCTTDPYCVAQILAIFDDAMEVYAQTLFEDMNAALDAYLDAAANCGPPSCVNAARAQFLSASLAATEEYARKKAQAEAAYVHRVQEDCCQCEGEEESD